MRIAISTGGGDAPGLNAVIRAVVLSAHHRGWRCYGIQRGYEGLLSFEGVVPLGPSQVRGITHLGGTILGTTNRGNPFRYISRDADGKELEVDRSGDLIAAFQASGFDALVSIGGDGSLQISYELWKRGLPVVCVPKTIDNDVSGTQRSFGFDTAVSTATEAIDRLHSTAESHDRVMVVELMGRYAGWIALYSGLSGSADVILLPEIPFNIEKVCAKIRSREAEGRRFSIVVVAEGARSVDGNVELVERRGVGGLYRQGDPNPRSRARPAGRLADHLRSIAGPSLWCCCRQGDLRGCLRRDGRAQGGGNRAGSARGYRRPAAECPPRLRYDSHRSRAGNQPG
jgi:6-phosphofructokinase 1